MTRILKTLAAILVALVAVAGAGRMLLRASVQHVPSNTWAATGDLAQARAGAASTLLYDGQVLVTGGLDATGAATAMAERYAPDSGAFLPTPAMQTPRANHTSTLLPDGRVLVSGGVDASGLALASAEIYDPATNSWSAGAPLNVARSGHTATALYDGRIVLAGGEAFGVPLESIEVFDLYDGTGGAFTAAASHLSAARTGHAAALTYDGLALIAGGFDGTNPLASIDVFDPNFDTVTAAPAMSVARAGLSATTLLDGKILLAGGAGATSELASAEVYDPKTGSITASANSMIAARQRHQAILLPHNNQVLIVGGTSGGNAVATAEVYVAWQGNGGSFFQTNAPATTTRAWSTGAALSQPAGLTIRTGPNDGLALIAGGTALSNAASPSKSVELYGFATVRTDLADYSPGHTVTITGSGWAPSESVNLILLEDPPHDTHTLAPVVADLNGNIISTEFVPDADDLGIRFYLTATSPTSQAQTSFLDGNVKIAVSPNNHSASTAGHQFTVDEFTNTTCTGTPSGTTLVSVNAGASTTIGGTGNSTRVSAPLTDDQGSAFSAWFNTAGFATSGATFCVPGTSNGSQTVTAVYGGANHIAFTNAPINAVVNTCNALTLQSQNSSNVVTAPFADIAVALSSSSGTGAFYSNNTCTTSITSTTVQATTANGVTAGNSPTFYYKDSTVGTPTVSADPTNNSMATATQLETITAACTAPSITTQPTNSTITYGANASFTAAASGSPTPTVQWQESTDGGTNFANLSGATSTTLSLTKPPVSSPARKYRAVFTNTCGGTQTATTTAATLTVNAATLTVAGITAQNKIYDATTAATLNTASAALVGVVSGDSVTLNTGSAVGTFASKDVANGINVQISGLTISGTSAGNYTLSQPTTTANITPKPLTVSGLSATNKVYDATTTATLSGTAALQTAETPGTGSTVDGKPYTGDAVTIGGTPTGTFASKDVANGISITVTGNTIGGAQAGNYTLTQQTGLTANITLKALTVSGLSANNKLYDATTVATVSGTAALAAAQAPGGPTNDGKPYTGDAVTVTGSPAGTFVSKDVANGITVTVSGLSLTGAQQGNYTLAALTLTANITPKALTVVGLTASNKVYDATTAAVLGGTAALQAAEAPGGPTNDGKPYTGDSVTIGGTASGAFASKDVATGIAITVTGNTIGGGQAGNYTLAQQTGLSADITPKALTVVGLTASNKVYDATTAAVLGGTAALQAAEAPGGPTNDGKPYTGDSVTIGGTASGAFASKDVATAIAITVTGNTIGGGQAGNYTLAQQTGLSADITPKALTVVGLTASNKVYDATTAAVLGGTAALQAAEAPGGPTNDGKPYTGDSVTIGGTASGAFASKDVATAIAITVTGNTIGGGQAGNYTLAQQTGLSADITPKALTVVGLTASNKVYDATTAAVLGGTAALQAAEAPGGPTNDGKPYTGDSVTIGGTASGAFASKDVATAIAITVTGNTIGGGQAGNYTLAQQTGLSADITPKALTVVGLTASNKVYDATTAAVLGGTAALQAAEAPGGPTNDGKPYTGDSVTIGGTASGAFASKDVAAAIAITVTGNTIGGGQAGNYTLAQQTGLSADITPKALTVVGLTASNKVYDATTAAVLGGTAALQAAEAPGGPTNDGKPYTGDSVTIGGTASGAFASKDVATAIAITVTGNTIGGGQAGNYTLAQQTGLSADITPKALTVVGLTASNKVYDATTAAVLGGTAALQAAEAPGGPTNDGKPYTGDSVTIGGTATGAFASKDVATAIAITVTGNTIGGGQAGNYTLAQQTGLSADITPKALTVVGLTASNKVYDATTAAVLGGTAALQAPEAPGGPTNDGKPYTGDSVTIGGTASGAFASKDVATAIAITVTGNTIGGGQAGNYTLAQQTGLSADITPKALTVVGLTASNKVYDGTTDATLSGTASLASDEVAGTGAAGDGKPYTGDVVMVSGTPAGTFASKNVANGISVGVSGLSLSGAAASNYTLNSLSLSANITPATLTYVADAKSRSYGASNPAFTGSVTGFVTGETQASATTGTLTFSSSADASSNVGSYAIDGSGLTANNGNYTFVQAAANATALTINKAALSITADAEVTTAAVDAFVKTYDSAVFSGFAARYVGFVNSETPAALGGALSFSGAGTTATAAGGPYTVTPGGQTSSNYDITFVDGSLTIEKRAVTVTADSGQTKIYGDSDPASYTYQVTSGTLAAGDSFTGALNRAAGEDVGGYAIQQGTLAIHKGATDVTTTNYTLTYVGATFAITKRAVTVTADSGQTKIYGDSNPASYTYQVTGTLAAGDSFTGALDRAAGEDVGGYAIQQGTLAIHKGATDVTTTNYTLTYVGASFTITKRAVTVTADSGQTKIYGDSNPASYTYQVTSGTLAAGDSFTGALDRAAGEDVGGYAIQQGTLAIHKGATDVTTTNYTLTYVGATFAITKRAVTVTADSGQTKIYGDSNPASYTYQVTGTLAAGDSFTGALDRAAGEDVGGYAIQQGTLAIHKGATDVTTTNYTLTYVGASFTITKRAVTVTADSGQTKIYGDSNPASYTYQVTSGTLAAGDSFTGALDRAAGEDVGGYAIQQGTLAIHKGATDVTTTNYTLTYVGASFTITKRAVTVTADSGQTKIYGDSNPASYTYQVTSGTLAAGDSFTGALDRAAGEDVGGYAIQHGTLAIHKGATDVTTTNYTLTYVGASFTITKRAVTVTADSGQTKIYGDANPASYTYQVTSGTLAAGDSFTGALDRAAGEDVGGYAIQQGTLAIHKGVTDVTTTNYTLTYVGASFTITKRAVTVTADSGQTKIYGDSNPASYTYQVTSGTLAAGDSFTGALDRAAGEDVGGYAIQQGTLAIHKGATDVTTTNYTLTYVGASFAITKRAVTVTADSGQTKIYGDSNPASYTYQVTSGTLAAGDSFTGALNRAAGEDVGGYAIQQGTLAIHKGATDVTTTNYTLTYVGATFAITKRAVTVTADSGQTKIYGDSNPASYTYQVTGTLAAGDSFTGALDRAAGEDVGGYAIQQGTLAIHKGATDVTTTNYTLTYVGASFTITKRAVTVTADSGQTKIYGDSNPASYTYQVTSGTLAAGDSFTGALDRAAGEDVGGYAIQQGTLAIHKGATDVTTTNYTLTYVGASFTITKRAVTVTADSGQTKIYGDSNPASYTYQVTSGTLAAGDSFTGALDRAAGEDVGSYAIQPGTLAIHKGVTDVTTTNYTLTYVGASFTITKRAVTVTADSGQTKIYGDANPASYTYQVTSGTLAAGDSFTGALDRAAGEDVGGYAIQHGTLAIHKGVTDVTTTNYTLTYVGATFTITKRAVTVTADSGQTKIYGDSNPASYTYQVTSGTLAAGDSFTGALDRAAGEDVGGYAIQQGTLAIHKGATDVTTTNYTLTYVGASFTITKRAVTVTADSGQTKIYGDSNPASYTYQVTSGTLAAGDSFTGALDRVAGEDVGGYAIQHGTLAIHKGVTDVTTTNYTLTYVGATFTITKRAVTVTADSGQTKIYGDANPASYTYQVTSGTLAAGDSFTGALDRAAGEDVGGYAIQQGTLAIHKGVTDVTTTNYTLTYVGASFTITKRAVTVTADSGQTKIYGDSNPASYTYQVTSGTLAAGDSFTGALDRAAGEDVGGYAIQQGTLAIHKGATDVTTTNYTLTYVGASFTITKRAVTVTADSGQTKIYGDSNPASYTYQVTNGTLAAGDSFTGALDRAAGEDVGGYAIQQGTLAIHKGVTDVTTTNYTLTFVGASFVVTKAALTITATDQSKTYGGVDPTFGVSYSGFVNSETEIVLTGTTIFNFAGKPPTSYGPSTTVPVNAGIYAIRPSGLASGNYDITFKAGTYTINKAALAVAADAQPATAADDHFTKIYAAANPAFSVRYEGFVNSENPSVLGGALNFATTAVGSPVGSYSVTPSGLTSANYTITYVAGTLDIQKATLTVTADAVPGTAATDHFTKVYGTANPSFSARYDGLVNGDTAGVLGGSLTFATTATASSSVGSYPVTPSGQTATNYTIVYVDGTLDITAAALTITADAAPDTAALDAFTKTYGAANPGFTGRYAGLVNGDTVTALGGTLTFATPATTTSPVGSYAVTPGGQTSGNYTITFVPGALNIYYGWDGFLQPINDTAHQIGTLMSKFKLGQTIPAKFDIKDANGNIVQQATNPTFTRTGNLGACDATQSETIETLQETTVPIYLFNGGHYQYNWSTKGLTAGKYRIFANLADNTQRYVDICLTK